MCNIWPHNKKEIEALNRALTTKNAQSLLGLKGYNYQERMRGWKMKGLVLNLVVIKVMKMLNWVDAEETFPFVGEFRTKQYKYKKPLIDQINHLGWDSLHKVIRMWKLLIDGELEWCF